MMKFVLNECDSEEMNDRERTIWKWYILQVDVYGEYKLL